MSLYAVGRSSVREALRLLESKGLIQRAPGGAFAVTDADGPLSESLDLLVRLAASDNTELFDVRLILERDAIRTLLHSSLASSYHVPGSPERAIEMHRLILDSIESGRSEEARDRMTEHLTAVEATTRRRRDV